MIRQAISCDICASEKKQTNHWFVASEQSGELRVSGWNSRNRLRPGMKHLCGQICLHKLVDEFMARTLAARPAQTAEDGIAEQHGPATDTSLIAAAGHAPAHHVVHRAAVIEPAAYEPVVYDEVESSARLVAPGAVAMANPAASRPAARSTAGLVEMPGRLAPEEKPLLEEAPRYTSRNWRAEAWDRERERELRAVERRSDVSVRRRSGS